MPRVRRTLLVGVNVPANVQSASNTLVVRAGAETAARLGIAEGDIVETVEAYWHRNRFRRVLWRLTGRKP